MNKKIAIIGANGFIGKALIEVLQNQGFEIVAFSRNIRSKKTNNLDYHLFELGKTLNTKDFEGVDTFVHLAYAAQSSAKISDTDINIISAKELIKLPVRNKIFISSFAAVPPVSNAYYGRCKVAIEAIFQHQTIIRPALVVGNGGLWEKLKKQIEKNRFVPLLNGGNQSMQIIHIEDLVQKIIYIIKQEMTGIHHLAKPEKTTYKQVIELISNQLNKKVVWVPIPIWSLRLLIKILSFMPNPPITEDNLEGLMASKYVEVEN